MVCLNQIRILFSSDQAYKHYSFFQKISSTITLSLILWIFQFWSDILFGQFRVRKRMYKAKCIIWISSCTLHLMLHTWFRYILLGLSQRMHYIIDTFITTSKMHITAFLWHFSFVHQVQHCVKTIGITPKIYAWMYMIFTLSLHSCQIRCVVNHHILIFWEELESLDSHCNVYSVSISREDNITADWQSYDC